MTFSNTQLIKKHDITIITNPQKIIKHVILNTQLTDKKLCYHDYFYDIMNPQK